MEESGGEVNLVDLPIFAGLVFMDLSKKSPKGRRSLCYDKEARIKRKKNAPNSSVIEEAEMMDIKVLNGADSYYVSRGFRGYVKI